MEGRQQCTVLWGRIGLPQSAPGMGTGQRKPEGDISAQFKEEFPVKRQYSVWLRIWLWSHTSNPELTHTLTLTKLRNLWLISLFCKVGPEIVSSSSSLRGLNRLIHVSL